MNPVPVNKVPINTASDSWVQIKCIDVVDNLWTKCKDVQVKGKTAKVQVYIKHVRWRHENGTRPPPPVRPILVIFWQRNKSTGLEIVSSQK